MDWTRGATIGRGSSATVSLATANSSGELFAVKSAELSKSQFLQREQNILASLDSHRVVKYIGCDVTRERNILLYNMFMEYAPRGSLADEICARGNNMVESEIGFYARGIAEGLLYLHSRGIVHCDIKTENILIGEFGAKIADFGCAKHVDEAAPIAGTPLFMAPEVARGECQGFPADVWALGCIIINLGTRGPVWPDMDDPVSAIYRIGFSEESPEIPGVFSEKGKDFLSKCLKREANERLSAKELLEHPFLEELNSYEKGFPVLDSNSPTSILDQAMWNSINDFEILSNSADLNSTIGRLSTISIVPNWVGNDDWITIRSSDEECSSSEDLFSLIDSNSNRNGSSEDLFFDTKSISGRISNRVEDSALVSNLNFEKHKENLLHF